MRWFGARGPNNVRFFRVYMWRIWLVALYVVATVVVFVNWVGCFVVDDIGRAKRGREVVVGSCCRCYVFRLSIYAGGVSSHKI